MASRYPNFGLPSATRRAAAEGCFRALILFAAVPRCTRSLLIEGALEPLKPCTGAIACTFPHPAGPGRHRRQQRQAFGFGSGRMRSHALRWIASRRRRGPIGPNP